MMNASSRLHCSLRAGSWRSLRLAAVNHIDARGMMSVRTATGDKIWLVAVDLMAEKGCDGTKTKEIAQAGPRRRARPRHLGAYLKIFKRAFVTGVRER